VKDVQQTGSSPDSARDTAPTRSGPSECWVVLGLGLLAFALRAVYVLDLRASPYFAAPVIDPAFHLDWARELAAGREFQSGPFFRAPLYPWFLALCLKVCGGSLMGVRLLQCALGAATTVLTYAVARRLFDRRVATLSGFGAATYWVLIYFDGELLLPTLSIPLNLLALWLTLGLGVGEDGDLQPRPSRRAPGLRFLGAGFAWGLAAITRPNVLAFMPLLVLWILRAPRKTPNSISSWAQCLWLTLGTLVPILPVTAYNTWVGGDSVLISSQAGVNLWIGNHPGSDGRTARVPGTTSDDFLGTAREAASLAEVDAGRALKASEVSSYYSRKTLEHVLHHPLQALAGMLHKSALFLRDEEISNNQPVRFFARHFSWIPRYSPLGHSVLAAMGLLGLVLVLVQGPSRKRFPLWGFVITYSLSVIAFFVCSRFRAPILPALMILGGHSVFWLKDAWHAGRRRAFGTGAALALLTLGVLWSQRADRRVAQADGLRHLAVGYALAGDLQQAERLSSEALERAPGDPQTLLARAGILEDLQRFEQADALLQQVVRMTPDDPLALDRLLGFLVRRARWADLEQRARAALLTEVPPQGPSYHLGLALLAQKRVPQAQAALEEAVRLDPGGSRAQAVLASILAGRGQPKRARILLGQALDHGAFANARRQESDAWRLLLRILTEERQMDEALRRAGQWVQRFPDSPQARAALERAQSSATGAGL